MLLFLPTGFLALDRLLHSAPFSLDSSTERARLISELEAGSGFKFPDGTKVLFTSKNDPRNPKTTYWVAFSPGILHLPGSLARAGDVYPPQLYKSVRAIEEEIFPFKISRPRNVKDYSWRHQNANLTAIVVEADLGSYTELAAVQQD